MKCLDWQARASRIQGKSSLPPSDEKTRGRPPSSSNENQVVDLERSQAAALAVSVSKCHNIKHLHFTGFISNPNRKEEYLLQSLQLLVLILINPV